MIKVYPGSGLPVDLRKSEYKLDEVGLGSSDAERNDVIDAIDLFILLE